MTNGCGPAARQRLHDLTQAIEVAREPVHAMHDHRVAGAHERHDRLQLRALRVFARRFVAEDAVELDVFQLTLGILVETADPDVADALTDHALPCGDCQERVMTLTPLCQSNRKGPYSDAFFGSQLR